MLADGEDVAVGIFEPASESDPLPLSLNSNRVPVSPDGRFDGIATPHSCFSVSMAGQLPGSHIAGN